ncbi:MAG: histidine phosphatase family protein [Anaerolineales bacterium]|nr:histidine phosphatase family protein [Anaerolineales bacterium]
MYFLTLLRHGESVGNLEDRFQGQADFPLTERGLRQAQALAQRWQREGRTFDRCISSPLQRARQTAEILCAALKISLELDNDWMELNNGLIAGMRSEEANRAFPPPALHTPYTRYGQIGESLLEVYLRAGRNLQKLLDAPPQRVLIVAHAGILNMFLFNVLHLPLQPNYQGARFKFGNTGFLDLTYDRSRHAWRIWNFDNTGDMLQ